MKKILKRLELISSFIDLEEEEDIQEQVSKLRKLSMDRDVENILKNIEEKHYENVIDDISVYLKRFAGLSVYEDPQIQGLKVELSILEKELNSLSQDKNEILGEISAFNSKYYIYLGAILEAIYRLERDVAQRDFDRGEIDEETLNESKREYQSYNKEAMEQSKEQVIELSDEEEKELKKCYRKASRLTHPDTVAEVFKEEATQIFIALNDAYKIKDLSKVQEVLAGLESGESFAYGSDSIDDKEVLRTKSKNLREKIKALVKEIIEMKHSETYVNICEIDDMDSYFEDLKENLNFEKEALELEMLKV